MKIRPFDGSKSDLDELMEMHIALSKFDYDVNKNKSHAEKIGDLYKMLYTNGAICNFVVKESLIIGFMLMFPDENNELTVQSLYLKKEYRNTILAGRVYKWLENWVQANYQYCSIVATNDKVCKMYDKRYKKMYTIYKYIPKGKNNG